MDTFGQKQPGYEKRHVANSGDACIGKKLLHLGEHFPVEAKVVSHGIGIGLVIRAQSIYRPSGAAFPSSVPPCKVIGS